MSPERKAERIVSALAEGGAALVDFEWAEGVIARAIRAAENARAEAIAAWIDSLDVHQSKHAGETLRALSAAIRSEFKSRAPKRKAGRA